MPFKDGFKQASTADLLPGPRGLLRGQAPEVKSVMVLTMPNFAGTIFEAREVLAGYARADCQTYVRTLPKGDTFPIAVPNAAAPLTAAPQIWNTCTPHQPRLLPPQRSAATEASVRPVALEQRRLVPGSHRSASILMRGVRQHFYWPARIHPGTGSRSPPRETPRGLTPPSDRR